MYERGCAAAAAGCTGGLAVTGWNVTWTVVAGVTLVLVGALIVRLVPRRAGAR